MCIIDWAALVPPYRATGADQLLTEPDNPGNWKQTAERSINHLRGLGRWRS